MPLGRAARLPEVARGHDAIATIGKFSTPSSNRLADTTNSDHPAQSADFISIKLEILLYNKIYMRIFGIRYSTAFQELLHLVLPSTLVAARRCDEPPCSQKRKLLSFS